MYKTSQQVLEKKTVLVLFDIKTFCKAKEVEAVGITGERDQQLSRTKQKLQSPAHEKGIHVGANSWLVLNPA